MSKPGNSCSRRQFLHTLAGISLASHVPAAIAGSAENQPGRPAQIAVCFGSGALHGYAHIGAIRAFESHAFKPDLVCGTSVGAIAGVLWAAGHDADSIERLSRKQERFGSIQPRIPLLGLGENNKLRDFIDRETDKRLIEDLPTRFACVATDLDSGEPVILDSGSTGPAVAASASIPLRYEPVEIDGRRLVDGALTAPVPVDAARALGAERVVVIDVAYRPYEEPVQGFTDVAFQTFHIMVNRLIDEQRVRADVMVKLNVHDIMRDQVDISALIEAGQDAVNQHWPSIEKLASNR